MKRVENVGQSQLMFDVINVIKGIKIIAFNFYSFYQIFNFFCLIKGNDTFNCD